MKKIILLTGIAAMTIFTACDEIDSKFYPELNTDVNVFSIKYEMTAADYSTIANTIKQPIEDKITVQNNLVLSKQAELKTAKNLADSTRIKAELAVIKTATTDSINKLKKETLYLTATSISTNKFFVDSLQFQNYIPTILSKKYLYGDEKSSIMVTYNFVIQYDTTKIASANKFILDTTSYKNMGISPISKSFYFATTNDADFKIPIWLKINMPYAKAGDVKLVRYSYKSTTITNTYSIFSYDGTIWTKYNTTVPSKAKFTFKGGKWEYIDTDILIDLVTGIGDFKAINVIGDQVWAWNSYNYMLMTGYVSGAYYDNEDWLVSPPMNFTRRTTPWLSFTHVGRYFGDVLPDNTKMKKAITIWVSTTSDGTSINPSEWTELPMPEACYPSGANWTFIPSTPISLAAYARKDNVRIAFKYLSSAADGAAGSWEIKNVYIYEE